MSEREQRIILCLIFVTQPQFPMQIKNLSIPDGFLDCTSALACNKNGVSIFLTTWQLCRQHAILMLTLRKCENVPW